MQMNGQFQKDVGDLKCALRWLHIERGFMVDPYGVSSVEVRA